MDCDDDNLCTTDVCDVEEGCVYSEILEGQPCDSGVRGVCDEDGVCLRTAEAGDVLITEIHQNPSAMCTEDRLGEWFELYNNTPEMLDLYGWTVASGEDLGDRISAALRLDPYGFAMVCRNGNPAENGGIACDSVVTDIVLGNDSDWLSIQDAALTEIDRVAWDAGATFPDPNGAAMSLDPFSFDVTANNIGGNWCEAVSSMGDCTPRNLGSPGEMNPFCAGVVCDGATTVTCGAALSGTTAGALDVLDDYPCRPADFSGGETIYHLTVLEKTDVTLDLTPEYGVDLDVLVLSRTCEQVNCMVAADAILTFTALPGIDYYFVVDGLAGARGDFDLAVNCVTAPVENCGNAMDDDGDGLADCGDPDCRDDAFCTEFCPTHEDRISCGGAVMGDTTGVASVMTTYACSDLEETGGELVYLFQPDASVAATFTLMSDNPQLDLFLLPTICYDLGCTHFGDSTLTADVTGGQTYYIVVDGRFGGEGEFTLSLQCE